MNDTVTLAEVEAQFQNEWVLLEDPVVDEQQQVVTGRVLFHSPDRDQVYQAAVRLRPRRSAFLFTGRLAADTAVAL